jgi:hypothetical protein
MRKLEVTILAVVLLAATAAGATAPAATGLQSLIAQVEDIIPAMWRVVEVDTARVPIGWSGPADGIYVMVEDTSTRFYHPDGFHYYSFYRIWLMPPDWEGEMRITPYVSDSVPAYLLGMNDDYEAFYHTAGGNVWERGPRALCNALSLNRICLTGLSRRVVDLEFDQRLRTRLKAFEEETGSSPLLSPQRILGLAGDGPNLYMEYLFTGEVDMEEESRLAALTQRLAGDVFLTFPEIESLYVRRCSNDAFTDTIVTRN